MAATQVYLPSISRVIEALQKLQAEHGDIVLVQEDEPEHTAMRFTPLTEDGPVAKDGDKATQLYVEFVLC